MKKITFYSQIPQKATSLKNMKLICIFFLYIFPQPAGIFYRLKIEKKMFPMCTKIFDNPSSPDAAAHHGCSRADNT